MPELPEVEVLARHLAPLLKGRTIQDVEARRPRVIRPTSERRLRSVLVGARFTALTRRGKYLLFALKPEGGQPAVSLLGHLGMTGRMYLQPADGCLAKHTAVVLCLGRENFVFEDTRYFGRLTLDVKALSALGPEPLNADFTVTGFAAALKRSAQPIKVKLLDQSVVAGVGNIYASEALFRARLSPRTAARRLAVSRVERLWNSVREVLTEAIAFGSTVPMDWGGTGGGDGLFYYGRADGSARSNSTPDSYYERLRVYDREGRPCERCGARIKRIVQSARSTFYCPRCQKM